MQANMNPFGFGEALIRVMVDEQGEVWTAARDVAKALQYPDTTLSNMPRLCKHVPSEWKGRFTIPTLGGPQDILCLSEQGLYFFLGRSDKPKALPFQKWLAGDVLPTLRKTGSYTLPGAAALESPAPRCALPDVPEMFLLRPALRQRLWQDALQTARLDNAGSDAAAQWFAALCRMMVAGHAPRGGVDEATRRILQFADERCRAEHTGRVSAAALYEAFTLWWCSRFGDPVPSQQMFGRVMCGRYVQQKRGGKSCYFGVRLAAQGAA